MWKKIISQKSLKLIKDHPYLNARANMAINDGTHIAAFVKEGPNQALRTAARKYMRSLQLPYDSSSEGEYVELDPSTSVRIADAFQAGKHDPKHPEVREAYEAMAKETMDQYEGLKKAGFKLVPWGEPGQPYQRSADFMKDVAQNKRLFVFKTINPEEQQSFGEGEVLDNPLLEETGEVIKDSAGKPHRMTINDVFRGVHDLYGHVKEGLPTGPRGEENAWRQHVRMFSPTAARAMTTETRGQNSWVNFGSHLRRIDGTIPRPDEPDYVPLPSRPYADQKAMLLPEEFSRIIVPKRIR